MGKIKKPTQRNPTKTLLTRTNLLYLAKEVTDGFTREKTSLSFVRRSYVREVSIIYTPPPIHEQDGLTFGLSVYAYCYCSLSLRVIKGG